MWLRDRERHAHDRTFDTIATWSSNTNFFTDDLCERDRMRVEVTHLIKSPVICIRTLSRWDNANCTTMYQLQIAANASKNFVIDLFFYDKSHSIFKHILFKEELNFY